MFESAIYLGEQCQPVPKMDSLDRVHFLFDYNSALIGPGESF
jgi:hypothetical protein